jgi:hypothetical protein
MTHHPEKTLLHVQCEVFRVGPDGLIPATVLGPGDEVVLVIQVRGKGPSSGSPGDLTIELYRGDRLRDRREACVDLSTDNCWSTAYRLHWGHDSAGSSRLLCRVLANGRQLARHQLLLGRPQVDAQGRFDQPLGSGSSGATMLAFEAMLGSYMAQVSQPNNSMTR